MKKVLSIVLAICMIISFAAISASASALKGDPRGAGTVIDEMSFTIDYNEPKIFESVGEPDVKSADENSYYAAADSIEWVTATDDDNWELYGCYHFSYGLIYGISFDVNSTNDPISQDVKVKVNGEDAKVITNGEQVTVIYEVGMLEYSAFEITGVPEAIIGESTSLENIKVIVEGRDDIVVVDNATLFELAGISGTETESEKAVESAGENGEESASQEIESSDTEFLEGKTYSVGVVMSFNHPENDLIFFEGDISNLVITANGKQISSENIFNGVEMLDVFVDLGEAHETSELSDNDSSDKDNSDGENSDKDNSDGDNSDKDNSDSDSSDTDVSKKPLYGDVDCNGKVNMEDVTALQKIIAKLATHEQYGEMSKINSDCDHNDEINMVDVTMIQKYLAKLVDTLDPVE